MRAGTTSWITGCSLWSRAGPPLRCVRSLGRACLAVAWGPSPPFEPAAAMPVGCSATREVGAKLPLVELMHRLAATSEADIG